jgi:hypothetical protein
MNNNVIVPEEWPKDKKIKIISASLISVFIVLLVLILVN